MTTTTLLSQRASPRCCGRGLAWKALLDTGWHGFPASAATSVAGRRPACPRLARRVAREGRRWRERPPLFDRCCGTGERSPAHTVAHGKHSPRGGRSLHSDPCGKAVEPARKLAPRTVKPGSGRGDGSSPGGDRGGPGSCGPQPGGGSPHSFRVLVVTDLLSQDVPLEDVQYLAGHANPRTTQIYDRRRRQVTRNIVERISV